MNSLRLCFAVFIVFTCYLKQTSSQVTLGPADLMLENVEDCENVEVTGEVQLTVSLRRVNRTTRVLDILLETEYDIDDSLQLNILIRKNVDGGFKDSNKLVGGTCKLLETLLEGVFQDFLSAIELDACPIPMGRYDVRDFIFDNNKFNKPRFYGQYQTELKILNGDEPLDCVEANYELVPKEDIDDDL